MDGALISCAFYPPEDHIKGIMVNKEGKRYVAEDSYHSRTSIFTTRQTDQTGYLIVDDSIYTGEPPAFGGYPVIVAVMEYGFMGGSMGSVVGETITRAIEYATERDLPIVIVSCSGGARMQESGLSLMQMAKTSAALAKFDEAGGLFISVLTDPTTGGVTASFAMLGDVILAEPKALIGFAGPRVIEQTIQQKLPEGFQRSEFLLEHGMLDMVVERSRMREVLISCLRFLTGAGNSAGSLGSPRAASEEG